MKYYAGLSGHYPQFYGLCEITQYIKSGFRNLASHNKGESNIFDHLLMKARLVFCLSFSCILDRQNIRPRQNIHRKLFRGHSCPQVKL